MKISEFLRSPQLNNSLIIGFYGGTNFGDELLLEVIQKFVSQKDKKISIGFFNPKIYDIYHHDFQNKIVDLRSKKTFLTELFKNETILIGGGGLWGLDANLNILLLGLLLFLCKSLLKKKIYLVGVGFYSSTNLIGRVSAWLTAHSAQTIFARDNETYLKFKKINANTLSDNDISFYMPELSFSEYESEAERITTELKLDRNCVIIGLRRFSLKHKNDYNSKIIEWARSKKELNFCILIFESRDLAPLEFTQIEKFKSEIPNTTGGDFIYNPIAFFCALKKNNKNLRMIAPQFHAQIASHLAGVPFLPIDYDNKNTELFSKIGVKNAIHVKNMSEDVLNKFISM